jgi:hypothetical protein
MFRYKANRPFRGWKGPIDATGIGQHRKNTPDFFHGTDVKIFS